ncbi:hypothetical protein QEN19_002273 [Hanseniaspora menglaensis]
MKTLDELCLDASLSYCYFLVGKKHVVKQTNEVIKNINSIEFFQLKNFNNHYVGVLPRCHARSFTVMNTIISEPASFFVQVISFFTIMSIIFFIKKKYTAVGRSEICYLYYLFAIFVIFSVVVENGVSPKSSSFYTLCVSIQLSLVNGCSIVLAFIGILPFKLWEDGSKKSLFFLKFLSLLAIIFSFCFLYFSFNKPINNMSFLSTPTAKNNAIILSTYMFNTIFATFFVFCEILTSLVLLKNYWILGGLILGLFTFGVGQALIHFFSTFICERTNHYIDGLFPLSITNLITYMMIYKCWTIATTEDLEFGVNMDVGSDICIQEQMLS